MIKYYTPLWISYVLMLDWEFRILFLFPVNIYAVSSMDKRQYLRAFGWADTIFCFYIAVLKYIF